MASASRTPLRPQETSTLYWLAVSLTPGLGPTRARRMLEHFGGVAAIFRASLTELEAAGIKALSAQSLATGKSLELASEELERINAAGVTVLGLEEPGYPPQLRQIYDPPIILYIRGDAALLPTPSIAMVGTRHPSPYGTGMAERLATDLATRG